MNPNFSVTNLNPQIINWMQNFRGINPPGMPIRKTPISRRKFSKEEDEKLKNLVSIIGISDWQNIAAHMENRNSRQCRERWKHYLSPSVSNDPWSESEDKLLCEKYNELGPRWSKIAKFFPKRTDITVKNRWISLNGRAKRARKIPKLMPTQLIEQVTKQQPQTEAKPLVKQEPAQQKSDKDRAAA